MATDHVLLESVQHGGAPVLRLYAWSPACLSLGRNQHACETYDADLLRAAGVDVVRRPTGGLAVLHDHEITYCVLAPLALFGGPRAAYRAISEALVDGLRHCGVEASLAVGGGRRDPRQDTAEPCFHAPADGEVVVQGLKLVGSAQRAERGALLQHGSILLGGSQDRILGMLAGAGATADSGPAAMTPVGAVGTLPAARAARAATLADLLGTEPDVPLLVRSLVAGFEARFGTCLAPGSLSLDEEARLPLLEAHYDDPSWTWRR